MAWVQPNECDTALSDLLQHIYYRLDLAAHFADLGWRFVVAQAASLFFRTIHLVCIQLCTEWLGRKQAGSLCYESRSWRLEFDFATLVDPFKRGEFEFTERPP